MSNPHPVASWRPGHTPGRRNGVKGLGRIADRLLKYAHGTPAELLTHLKNPKLAAIDIAAIKMILCASDGNHKSTSEIWDRLIGRARQSIEFAGNVQTKLQIEIVDSRHLDKPNFIDVPTIPCANSVENGVIPQPVVVQPKNLIEADQHTIPCGNSVENIKTLLQVVE